MKVMVRPILVGISRMAKTMGTDPLDKEEIDSGTIAWSALMYQYGAMLDARVLVGLWCAGVAVPRAIQYMENKAKEEETKRNPPRIEKEVSGQVTAIKQAGIQ